MNPNFIIGLSILQLTAILCCFIGFQVGELYRRYSPGVLVVFLAEVALLSYFIVCAHNGYH